MVRTPSNNLCFKDTNSKPDLSVALYLTGTAGAASAFTRTAILKTISPVCSGVPDGLTTNAGTGTRNVRGAGLVI
jgi:hypothetical protein